MEGIANEGAVSDYRKCTGNIDKNKQIIMKQLTIIKRLSDAPSLEELQNFEQEFNIILPPDIRDVIFNYAGCSVEECYFPASPGHSRKLTGFFELNGWPGMTPISDFVRELVFRKMGEVKFVPLFDSDGLTFCAKVSGPDAGDIYFFPTEYSTDENGRFEKYHNLTVESLINSLSANDPDIIT